MTDPEPNSTDLRDLVVRIQAGDRGAEDRLVRAILGRFQNLARRMLNQFPDLRHREQTGDVVQDALLRLLRALKDVTPQTSRDFFNLAAEQIRRQLLDLARRHRRAHDRPAPAARRLVERRRGRPGRPGPAARPTWTGGPSSTPPSSDCRRSSGR